MPIYIVPDDGSDRIITFDVIEGEVHDGVSEVTDHPVESGINASDHVRPLPDFLSIIGYVTNHPIKSNPFTQRGELKSVEIKFPEYEIPPNNPGAIYRAGLEGLSGLIGKDGRTATVLGFSEIFDAVRETYEVLEELRKNAVFLNVYTKLRTYEDMILTRVSAPRAPGDSGVSFSCDFRQVRVVESGVVASPPIPEEPKGLPEKAKGSQGTTSPNSSDAEQPTSIAYGILQSMGAPL